MLKGNVSACSPSRLGPAPIPGRPWDAASEEHLVRDVWL